MVKTIKNNKVAIVLGVVCCILVICIFTQMKTVNNMENSVGTSLSANSELIDEVLRAQEDYDKLYSQLENAEDELENIRTIATAGNQEATEAEAELKENNMLLGLTDVKGEGIIITLDDNRNIENPEGNLSQYLVHEEDLLQVINELFNAEAEAVSINDNRVTNITAVRCDGNIIRVNGQVITVPITIKAICSKAIYNTLIRPGGYLQIMADAGVIVQIERKDEITIPKYNGVFSSTHLTRGDE